MSVLKKIQFADVTMIGIADAAIIGAGAVECQNSRAFACAKRPVSPMLYRRALTREMGLTTGAVLTVLVAIALVVLFIACSATWRAANSPTRRYLPFSASRCCIFFRY
jgi:uncharacterized membrane protein